VGKAGAGRRVGNADEVMARRALNLPAGMAGIALERLIAVRTVEFEFGAAHNLFHPLHASAGRKKYGDFFCILLAGRWRI
jgi:hypothetical protein